MNKYKKYTDEQIIDALVSNAHDGEFYKYFFHQKCKDMLIYISRVVYRNDEYQDLIGEFYLYLSKNDWRVLRLYKKKNNASLCSYLSHCAVNYFLAKKKLEDKYDCDLLFDYDDIDLCNEEADEDYTLALQAIKIAFSKLKEKHQETLEQLVIQNKNSLEAAEVLWQYSKNKNKNLNTLPRKKIQDTIAAYKKDACAQLTLITLRVMEQLRRGEIPA